MRRFRRQTFGAVSQRERQNAELFFEELLGGRRGSRVAAQQEDEGFFEGLVSAPPHPAALLPAYESDESAEAPGPDPAPTVKQGADKDEIIVTRADGTVYHVRRKVHVQILEKGRGLRTGFCSNDERVFFRLAWCEGTQGRIDVGANPQDAFKKLLDKIVDQINNGASPDQIKQTLENASIQTFLEVDIAKVGSWRITGDVKLDINRSGVVSGGGGVSADVGWMKIGVEVTVGPDGKQVMLKVDIPLEGRKIKEKDCKVHELLVWWDVECFKEVPVTIKLKPPEGFRTKTEQLFLYFDYAKSTLRRDKKPSTTTPPDEIDAILKSDPTVGTARLNKRALERLDYLVGQGYWLLSVEGFTSPEGLRPRPRDPRVAAKWEGNDELSRERAKKVRDLIESRYVTNPGLLRMRFMKFPPDRQMPQGVGKSELPKLDDRLGKELEGPRLDRAMILGDKTLPVNPFLDDHPEELTRMTAEDQTFVTDKRNSVRDRAERLFENLRRVVINLEHREPFKEVPFTTTMLQPERPCSKDIADAAERQWGPRVRIPLSKPDPPLCK